MSTMLPDAGSGYADSSNGADSLPISLDPVLLPSLISATTLVLSASTVIVWIWPSLNQVCVTSS